MVFTTEERVWLVEHLFREDDRNTDAEQQRFIKKFPDRHVPHRNTQFVILLISFEKQNQCMMPNVVEQI